MTVEAPIPVVAMPSTAINITLWTRELNKNTGKLGQYDTDSYSVEFEIASIGLSGLKPAPYRIPSEHWITSVTMTQFLGKVFRITGRLLGKSTDRFPS